MCCDLHLCFSRICWSFLFFWVETLEFHSWIRGPSRLIAEFSLNFLRWRLGWRSAHGGLGLWRVVRVKGRDARSWLGGWTLTWRKRNGNVRKTLVVFGWICGGFILNHGWFFLSKWFWTWRFIFMEHLGEDFHWTTGMGNMSIHIHQHWFLYTRLASKGLTFSWKAFHRSDVFFLKHLYEIFINGGFHHVSPSHAPT